MWQLVWTNKKLLFQKAISAIPKEMGLQCQCQVHRLWFGKELFTYVYMYIFMKCSFRKLDLSIGNHGAVEESFSNGFCCQNDGTLSAVSLASVGPVRCSSAFSPNPSLNCLSICILYEMGIILGLRGNVPCYGVDCLQCALFEYWLLTVHPFRVLTVDSAHFWLV